MNVNNDVPAGATALRGLDVEGVSNFVLAGLQRGLEHLASDVNLPALYAPYDVLVGKRLRLSLDSTHHEGVGAGIDQQGCLLLETQGKVINICHSHTRSSTEVIT